MTIETLIKFIEGHDCTATKIDESTLFVKCKATYKGAVIDCEEVIPATLRAAKDWLGY